MRPLRVLLVEDSEDSQLLIHSYLKKTPYILECAENGQQGVDMFRAGKYDIVLMDTQMPVMDGMSSTRAIRAWELERGLKATPIVALTAHALRTDDPTQPRGRLRCPSGQASQEVQAAGDNTGAHHNSSAVRR